jgi:ADP-ribosylation factor-like protein 13B
VPLPQASGEAVPPLPSAAAPSTTEAPIKSQAKADDTARPPTGAGDTLPSEDTSPPPGPAPAPFVKAFNVLLLGMDGSGKSSLLATLKGDVNPCPQPTIGFRFAKMMTDGGTRVTFYDLGGGMDPRRLWVNYYHDVHGVVFVLDGAEAGRWQESLDLLGSTLAHKYLVDKPLLLLVSKQDQPSARTPEDLQQELKLGFVSSEARREDVKVSGAVLNASKNGDVIDPRLEQSLQWLFERVKQGFSQIDARVQRDSAEAKEEFAREEAVKDRERLKNFIHKACLEAEAGGSDCFTPQEVCSTGREGRLTAGDCKSQSRYSASSGNAEMFQVALSAEL